MTETSRATPFQKVEGQENPVLVGSRSVPCWNMLFKGDPVPARTFAEPRRQGVAEVMVSPHSPRPDIAGQGVHPVVTVACHGETTGPARGGVRVRREPAHAGVLAGAGSAACRVRK